MIATKLGKGEGRKGRKGAEPGEVFTLPEPRPATPRCYVSENGYTIFVSRSMPDVPFGKYGTYFRRSDGALVRVQSAKLPMRISQEDAQADLDAYAARHKLPDALTPAHLVGEQSGALANANRKTPDTQLAPRPSAHSAVKPALTGNHLDTPLAPLDSVERTKFRKLESIVEKGKQAFFEVGRALAEIQAGRLYRGDYLTWDDYLRDRWGMSRSHADRQITASKIAAIASPIGDKMGLRLTNESQFRPIANLDPADVAAVLKRAKAKMKAEGTDQVTAKILAAAVREETMPAEDIDRQAERAADRRHEPSRPASQEVIDVPPPAQPAADFTTGVYVKVGTFGEGQAALHLLVECMLTEFEGERFLLRTVLEQLLEQVAED